MEELPALTVRNEIGVICQFSLPILLAWDVGSPRSYADALWRVSIIVTTPSLIFFSRPGGYSHFSVAAAWMAAGSIISPPTASDHPCTSHTQFDLDQCGCSHINPKCRSFGIPERVKFMKVLDAIRDRRAVRAFRDEPVSESVLRELINISTNAPSFMNQQPWAYSVVSDPKTVAKVGRQVRAHLRRNRSHPLLFPAIGDREDPWTSDIFYGAPALIVISATTEGYEAEMACAMAAYALMLAAATMGLGACWVSHADSWFSTSEGRDALRIPATYRPVATLLVGAPLAAPVSPGRLEPEVHWVKTATDPLAPKAFGVEFYETC